MGRPTIFDRPLTNYEMVKRWRQRQRGEPVAKPERTDAEELARARREIWHLLRRMRKLEERLSEARQGVHQHTAPLYMEIKALKDRLAQYEPPADTD